MLTCRGANAARMLLYSGETPPPLPAPPEKVYLAYGEYWSHADASDEYKAISGVDYAYGRGRTSLTMASVVPDESTYTYQFGSTTYRLIELGQIAAYGTYPIVKTLGKVTKNTLDPSKVPTAVSEYEYSNTGVTVPAGANITAELFTTNADMYTALEQAIKACPELEDYTYRYNDSRPAGFWGSLIPDLVVALSFCRYYSARNNMGTLCPTFNWSNHGNGGFIFVQILGNGSQIKFGTLEELGITNIESWTNPYTGQYDHYIPNITRIPEFFSATEDQTPGITTFDPSMFYDVGIARIGGTAIPPIGYTACSGSYDGCDGKDDFVYNVNGHKFFLGGQVGVSQISKTLITPGAMTQVPSAFRTPMHNVTLANSDAPLTINTTTGIVDVTLQNLPFDTNHTHYEYVQAWRKAMGTSTLKNRYEYQGMWRHLICDSSYYMDLPDALTLFAWVSACARNGVSMSEIVNKPLLTCNINAANNKHVLVTFTGTPDAMNYTISYTGNTSTYLYTPCIWQFPVA